MELGNKIIKLRKKEKMSQEVLADKIGVTRQTISNWELNMTKPDVLQIKKLSKIFNVSIDELLDNDVRDIVEKKISNTEKLTDKTTKNVKIIVITLYFIILSILIWFIIYCYTNKDFTDEYQFDFTCYLDDEVYNLVLNENEDGTFDLEIDMCKKDGSGCEMDSIMAGSSLYEAFESRKVAKNVLISQGAICK